MLSVLIPARNEIYLEQTIQNVLANARGDIEVLVMLDGYTPDPQIVTNDDRVQFFHHEEARGQRASINELARHAKGEYIMKLDAHCAVDEGFDVKLAQDCEYDWTVVPRMYNLDVQTFAPKLHKKTDYMFIGMNEKGELRSQYYTGQEWKKWHAKTEEIDDTMGLMGPCFFMHKQRFFDLGGCDETQGGPAGWGQQGIEVACKAWLSGGSLKVNKKTWFAHWFRASDGGFPYDIKESDIQKTREMSKELWLGNKWGGQVRKFEWLIDKFKPEAWKPVDTTEQERTDMQKYLYRNIHLKNRDPRWRGLKLIKLPSDIVLYQMVVWDKKPDFIIDIGTAFGASAMMFADYLEMTGKGTVITIDPNPRGPLPVHPRIICLEGDSKSDDIINKVKEIVGSGSVMLSIDGNHKRQQVKWELKRYADIVTRGQFMVVEDCYDRNGLLTGPGEARDWFLKWNKQYRLTDFDRRFICGFTKDGWLLKK